jgi:hypothetical protein
VGTLKDDQQSIFAVLGVTDMAGVTAKLEEWQNGTAGLQRQLTEICALVGATDYAGATAAIAATIKSAKDFQANLQSIFGVLKNPDGSPVTDHTAALAAIELWKTNLAVEKGKTTDFEGKVATEVNTRIASAGLPAPVAKVAGDALTGGPAAALTMSRAEFNVLNHGERLQFSQKGGKLTDE